MIKKLLKSISFVASVIPALPFFIFLVKKLKEKDYKYHNDEDVLFI